MRVRVATPLLLVALSAVAGCSEAPRVYETSVEVRRFSVVRRDEERKPVTADVEVSYADCPGTQYEVVRGNRAFTECFQQHKVGERVPLRLEHYRGREGRFEWVVKAIGGCDRPPDPNDEVSFSVVEECSDLVVHGARVGFHCSRIPEKELVQKCPWFRRY
jgi:hypothetical protein